ncbi:MAG: Na/Pi cotransporter family protein [Clostridia bacterium]|nr:Na/Pi cotransporter family protein [Clostridia bacterium]
MTPGEIIIQILSLAGALVIFLYGMKTMSEALQKLAGERLRRLLARITTSTARGIVAGFGVTAILQSSSAVTVMLVSFVNAGLITFGQSLGVIFGANIGTTITAWLIYSLGFSNAFNIETLLLPLAALALPLFFVGKVKNKAFAEMMIGFVLIFLGLAFFRETVPAIDENFALFHQSFFPDNFYFNTFYFVLIGIFITLLFQSSSATIALTMVLATQGWLTYSTALAMVLGENIGTTLTANLAAIVTNRAAKRTALAHSLFNILGLVWVIPFIRVLTHYIEGFTTLVADPENSIPLGVAIFHSSFNVINTLLAVALLSPFGKMCYALLPEQRKTPRRFSLKFLSGNLVSTAELNILQDKKKLGDFTRIVSNMFTVGSSLLNEKDDRKFAKKYKRVARNYQAAKEAHQEIAVYLQNLLQEELTPAGRQHVKAVAQISESLKSVAILKMSIVNLIENKNKEKAWFTQDLRNKLLRSLQLIDASLAQTSEMLKDNSFDYNDTRNSEFKTSLESLAAQPDFSEAQIGSNALSYYQQMASLIISCGEFISIIEAAVAGLDESILLPKTILKV